jgi:hypothetical protein
MPSTPSYTYTPPAEAAAIARAAAFRVIRFAGRGRYDELGRYPSLATARSAKAAAGRDEFGRPAMIYALAPGRAALFVE